MRRFTRKPSSCFVIPIRRCKGEMRFSRFAETGECWGFQTSEDNDEPHSCCKVCVYLARDLRGDA